MPLVVPLHHFSPAEESQYPWTCFERAKHDGHAPVFVDVRHRLGSGARGIDVRSGIGGEDSEGGRGETFGGDVDVRARERRRGGEEDWLGEGLEIEEISVFRVREGNVHGRSQGERKGR